MDYVCLGLVVFLGLIAVRLFFGWPVAAVVIHAECGDLGTVSKSNGLSAGHRLRTVVVACKPMSSL